MLVKKAAFVLPLIILLFEFHSALGREVISIDEHDCVAGHILVKFDYGAVHRFGQNAMNARQQAMAKVNAEEKRIFASGFELWRVSSESTINAINSLKNNPFIKCVEPDYIYFSEIIPDDPFFSNMWGLHNTGQSGGIIDADIDAPEAWEIARGCSTVIVGIVDSGIDYAHPDLRENIWINAGEIENNGIDDDLNGYVDDARGYDFDAGANDPMDAGVHGTHVAGIIGAKTNNLLGTSGIAWDVRLMPLKFMDEDGRGAASDAIAAIEYAIKMGAQILNLSWGGTAFSEALYETLASADSAGLLIVASAGNAGTDNDDIPHSPSSYDLKNLIAVTAADDSDHLPAFANWGVESVDLAAPGVSILSTAPSEQYGYMSGSSMAVPHVSGAGVLLWSMFPELTASEVKRKLLASVDQKQSLIGTSQTAGRLNAHAALTDTSTDRLDAFPNFLEFGITLKDHTSPTQKVYLANNSSEILTTSLITAPDGFLIAHGSEPDVSVESFLLNPWSIDSLDVIFSPMAAMDYRRFIELEYFDSDGLMEVEFIQVYGRSVEGTLVQPGTVSGTWSAANEPYYIMGDVSALGSLVIEAGVHIEFQGAYSLTIGAGSSFEAVGTESDSIIFYPYDAGDGWGGIRFLNSGDDDVLSYCVIQDCKKLKSADLEPNQNGGAIYCSSSSPTIQHCLIANNFAIAGGGLYLTNSNAIIENSSIINNRAMSDGGGGIACHFSNPQLFKVVVANNRSLNFFADGDNGGGILCWSSSPKLLNVTLAGNVADKGGGFIYHKKHQIQ